MMTFKGTVHDREGGGFDIRNAEGSYDSTLGNLMGMEVVVHTQWEVAHALDILSLARQGYDAYAAFTGGLTWDKKPMPEFDTLPDNIKGAWAAVARKLEETVVAYHPQMER